MRLYPTDPRQDREREYEIHEASHAIVLAHIGVQGISVNSRRCRFDSCALVPPFKVLIGLYAGYFGNLTISGIGESEAARRSESDRRLARGLLSEIPAGEREEVNRRAQGEAERIVAISKESIRELASEIHRTADIDSHRFETLDCVKGARLLGAAEERHLSAESSSTSGSSQGPQNLMSAQSRQLFGTDGIRGVAGDFPLTADSTYLIGRALGHDLLRGTPKAQALMGQDTRESSEWIADRVAAGLAAVGVEVHSAGVITTPGVAYLARSRGFAAGVVISASHNPWTDNGIKVFSGDGFKLTDTRELAIEKEIFALLERPGAVDDTALKIAGPSLPGEAVLRKAYIESLASSVSSDLSRLRVLVDCANGAATAEAPELFLSLGVQATFMHVEPDGRNINDGCGALHPETLGKAVAESGGKFDLGVTFDGDADRALFCDADGRVVNGDGVLLLTARDLQAQGKLNASTVVATTMSNMGVEIALKKAGIRMLRANVGDKYVLEEMLKTGATLGGEQSGHIIFRDGDATTGDGLLTALRVMDVIVRSQMTLGELVGDLKVFPQKIQNVRVREKIPFAQVPEVQQAIDAAESELDGNGRVVVRYSGTEALARVMVEAESEERMQALTAGIAAEIQKALGV